MSEIPTIDVHAHVLSEETIRLLQREAPGIAPRLSWMKIHSLGAAGCAGKSSKLMAGIRKADAAAPDPVSARADQSRPFRPSHASFSPTSVSSA